MNLDASYGHYNYNYNNKNYYYGSVWISGSCLSIISVCLIFYHTGDVEYWNEEDSEIDEDFSPVTHVHDEEPPTPAVTPGDGLSSDEQSVVWWMVAFTCMFETLHCVF